MLKNIFWQIWTLFMSQSKLNLSKYIVNMGQICCRRTWINTDTDKPSASVKILLQERLQKRGKSSNVMLYWHCGWKALCGACPWWDEWGCLLCWILIWQQQVNGPSEPPNEECKYSEIWCLICQESASFKITKIRNNLLFCAHCLVM